MPPARKKRKVSNARSKSRSKSRPRAKSKAAMDRPTLKRKADDPLVYPGEPKWARQGGYQDIISRRFERIEPTAKVVQDPTMIEFDLHDGKSCWRMGPNTYFKVKGQFQEFTPAQLDPVEPEVDWKGIDPDQAARVIVQPNFFECLIRKTEIRHGQVLLNTEDEGAYVAPYINTFLYSMMDADVKKKLCMHPCHTGNGVPVAKGGWVIGEDSEWTKYSKTIFLGAAKNVSFEWRTLSMFPFMQYANFMEQEPKVLPNPNLKNIGVRILLHENKSFIYKKTAGNRKLYRFVFSDFALHVEKLVLGKTALSFLLSQHRLGIPGVTRVTRRFNIPAGNATFHATVQKTMFPEGLFIMALNKDVPTGAYEYKNNTNGDVFLPHNIQSVKFSYGNLNFFTCPVDIGMITKPEIESKLVSDYREFPPFGLKIDEKRINLNSVKNGSSNTPYPHVFINLKTAADGSRLLPEHETGVGSVLGINPVTKHYNDLDLTFTFNADGGATNDATYFVYLYYTDVSAIIDRVAETITNPYITTTAN